MRRIAPSGTPIRFAELAGWARDVSLNRDALESFREAVCARFNARHCFFVSTGRAAMTLILRALRASSDKGRTEVIVPAYTCYSVPASVRKAGLAVRVCDVDPDTLGYDLQRLAQADLSNVLCIVTSNLYGIPDDLPALERIASLHGVRLLDDAAQCMGGLVGDRFAGTFGDAGIFSLDKGKNITTLEGGIIVTRSGELADLLREDEERLPVPGLGRNLKRSLSVLFYAAFLRPGLYWIPNGLPVLGLGATNYTEEYDIEAYAASLAGLGVRLLERLPEINRTRIENAEYLLKALAGTPRLLLPRLREDAKPVFLRLPVRIPDEDRRKRLIAELNKRGVTASASYPGAINDIPEVRKDIRADEAELAGGRTLARQIVTLPTHPYVRRDDLAAMVDVIRKECA